MVPGLPIHFLAGGDERSSPLKGQSSPLLVPPQLENLMVYETILSTQH